MNFSSRYSQLGSRSVGPLQVALLAVALLLSVQPDWSVAQNGTLANEEHLDARILHAVYSSDGGVTEPLMRGADVTAYPLFVLLPAATWADAHFSERSYQRAFEVSAVAGITFIATHTAKYAVSRERPFVRYTDVESRSGKYDGVDGVSPHSFPSGHATMAAALATSISLNYADWRIIAPAGTWAGLVGLSRLWMGEHYPSDVAGGMLLGASIALGTHALGNRMQFSAAPSTSENGLNWHFSFKAGL